MAFQGSLKELHLPDVIQLVSVSAKTGCFHLSGKAGQGLIYLLDGNIVHAAVDDLVGEEAVFSMAVWNEGEFRFAPGEATPESTITRSNTNLMMEAARRLDEWRVLSKRIPSVDMVPVFDAPAGQRGQVSLNTQEWFVLAKIDGNRSIRQIAKEGGLSAFDVAKALYGLVGGGLIRFRAPEELAALKTVPPKPAGPAVKASVVAAPPPAQSPATPPAQSNPNAAMVKKLDALRQLTREVIGPVGEAAVARHINKAKADIEAGKGVEGLKEAAEQIARAAELIKGPQGRKLLDERIKSILG
jgi:hypothetical protein